MMDEHVGKKIIGYARCVDDKALEKVERILVVYEKLKELERIGK